MLAGISEETLQRFAELGAVQCSVITVPRYHRHPYYNTDLARDVRIPIWDLVHFWNADGTEIGYANTWGMGLPPVMFDPPRAWAPQFKEHMIVKDFRRSPAS